MKIICVDNFDIETISDRVIATNVSSKRLGEIMIKALNDREPETSVNFYKLVEDDYKLFEFKP